MLFCSNQNLLCFSHLFKNVEIKIYKTIILSVSPYECKVLLYSWKEDRHDIEHHYEENVYRLMRGILTRGEWRKCIMRSIIICAFKGTKLRWDNND